MQMLAEKSFRAAVGQLELIGKGSISIIWANARIAAFPLAVENMGPYESMVETSEHSPMGLCMNMGNISSLAHTNICTQSKTGPTLPSPRNTTVLHMGSTDNYDIIYYMGSKRRDRCESSRENEQRKLQALATRMR